MRFLSLMLLLLPLMAVAQGFEPPSGLQAPETEAQILHEQAILSFQQGNYSQAEIQYQALFSLEPYNQEALDGLFATWDALGKYQAILKQAAKLEQADSELVTANYKAFALLQLSRIPEARHEYHQALKANPGNFAINSYSYRGLGYTYQALGDYYQSKKYFLYAQTPGTLYKSSFSTTLAYKIPGENKTAFSLSQQAEYQSWKLMLSYENFLVDQNAFRQSYAATLNKQFSPVDISIRARSLQGKDARVYPAWQSGINAEPKLYLGKIILKPALGLSYSHYPRFDAQQLSLNPTLLWRDFSFSYALHGVYLDNETPDADSLRYAQQLQIRKALPLNLSLGLHYGTGNDTWLIDADNVAVDTFNQHGTYYGASLSVPLLKLFSIYAYHQRGKHDSLSYLSLAVRY